MKSYLITVICEDRIGVIRDVTKVLFDAGANLTDLRQNVMHGIFTFHCVAEFQGEGEGAFIQLSKAFESDESAEICFRELRKGEGFKHEGKSRGQYVAAVTGPDKPGRVHLITKVLADYQVNVEDWRHDLSDRGHALTIGLVTIPPKADITKLSADLKAALAPHGLTVSLRHENIFRATNEVGPIDALIQGTPAK